MDRSDRAARQHRAGSAPSSEKFFRGFPNSVVDVGPAQSDADPDPVLTRSSLRRWVMILRGRRQTKAMQREGTQHASFVAMAKAMAAARAAIAGATAAVWPLRACRWYFFGRR